MITTFHEVWYFIETTFVHEDLLELIDPKCGYKIPTENYVVQHPWENRFDMNKLRMFWEDGYSFIVKSSLITSNIRQLIEEVEEDHNVDAQCHVYMGKFGSRSFPVHSDNPDNLIVQCVGQSKVTLYDQFAQTAHSLSDTSNLTIKDQIILEPGNSIYIPSLQYHLFEPLTDRLSISIPMYKR